LLAASASWLVRTGVAMADGRDGTALSTSYFADRLLRPESSASSARTDDAQLRAEFERTLQVQALTGTLNSDDRAYLARQVSRLTGLSPADAQARVGAVSADIERGRVEARNHADRVRKDAAHFSLWFALALLTGAFSASIAATLGGKQRDRVESPESITDNRR
jgi:hypothetical protein